MAKRQSDRRPASYAHRCQGTNKRGEPCAATVVGSDGFCSAHSGRQDMRELGRKGGKGRNRPRPERVHESLRDYLKREVPPARVWEALETAMGGNNESARVAASRVLIDALHEPADAKGEAERVGAEARARLQVLLERQSASLDKAGESELAAQFRRAAADLWPEGEELPGGVVVADVSPEKATAILEGLVECGLLVPGHEVERRAEERAQELARSLREEFASA